jgi:hypothetical protein
MNIFSREVTITPVASQPGASSYSARGIFDTNELEIEALEESWVTSTRTELDIMQTEFPVLPMQDDLISIPEDQSIPGGEFVVSDVTGYGNAGGEVTLVLKRLFLDRIVGTAYSVGLLSWSFPALSVRDYSFSIGYLSFESPWLTVTQVPGGSTDSTVPPYDPPWNVVPP